MEIVTKVCTQCGEEKPLEEYHKQSAVAHGYRAECKRCARKRSAERNRRPEVRARKARINKEHQARMDSYFASRGCTCELCFQKHHIAALDLHHLDPSTKSTLTAFVSRRWTPINLAKVTAEADTCALLCASCHRMEHVALREGWSLMASHYPQVDTNLDWRLRYDEVCRNSKEASGSGTSLARAFQSFRRGKQLDTVRQAAGEPSGGLPAGDGRETDVGGAACTDSGPGSGKFVTDIGC